MKHFKNQKSL